ncbi:MAG TPA: hypothetical protein PK771_13685, partial [Spirochaetota bacterium]|nr:hypothetical protein [Spirochaetota bacterium]
MKIKILLPLFISTLFSFTLFADVSTDYDLIEKDWKEFIKKTDQRSDVELASSFVLDYETDNLNGRYESIKDFPKKLKIENYEHIQVPVRDRLLLDCWYVPATNSKGTVLISPWHTGNMTDMPKYPRFLLKKGYS